MTTSTDLTVALLGTGTMGAGMARNIAGVEGVDLRVWNRTRERAESLGEAPTSATVAGSVAEAVAQADVVVTVLYDADSTLEALEQARGSVAPGAVWLQTGTLGVAGTERAVALAEDLGLVLVDAPVLGTKKPAEDGALVVLASGPTEARPRVEAVLDAIGSRTMWVGEAGAGTRLKLAANAWVLSVVEGVAQSLGLARALGVDPALFLEAVSGGALDAPYVQLKGSAMLADELDPSFALAGALKDADLILEAAADAGAEASALAATRQLFQRAVDAGHGADDMAAVFRVH